MMMSSDRNILLNDLADQTWEGNWDRVKSMYNKYPEVHTHKISDSVGTALHVAIDLDEGQVVKDLVDAIMTHHMQTHQRKSDDNNRDTTVEALEVVNERGDTPLHLAASRGFARICKIIIGSKEERIYLLSRKNNLGETPVFLAALNWQKEAFAYLHHISKGRLELEDLKRDDGNSILHTAIEREYFDLAVIIVRYYEFLRTHLNEEQATPLKILATRPSAFKSGSKLSWYKRILYQCILVEDLDAERTMKSYLRKMEAPDKKNEVEDSSAKMKFPSNCCNVLYDFVSTILLKFATPFAGKKKKQQDTEDPSSYKCCPDKYTAGFLPPNYETFHQFIKSAYVNILRLSGVELKDVKNEKKKHQRSGQLLMDLMEGMPYAAFTGTGGRPPDMEVDADMYGVFLQRKPVGSSSRLDGKKTEPEGDGNENTPTENKRNEHTKTENENKLVDKKETPFLAAARNGIVEIVQEILDQIPSAIHNTNSKKENVLLVAVKHRQPLIVQTLKTIIIIKNSKIELWNNLILAVDDQENTMLHLAAEALGGDKPWQIAGSALQMMWDIKWFQNTLEQYIKSLVPEHFYFRSNKSGETDGEIFKRTHKVHIKDSSDWLKDTSESCSVVAALVAGVSFATASTIPGGDTPEGRPVLEGQPAFDTFAIASLIGLCFSVTGLIMFLSILTSRKEANDFRKDLPLKLLLGLSSLFVSIAALFVSFCTGHFFLVNHEYKSVMFPIYAATCVPVTFYAVAQFPLYLDLLTAILTKVPMVADKGGTL